MTAPESRSARNTNPSAETGILARIALALTDWTERWVPDAFVFALIATLIVIVAGVAFTPSSLPEVIDAWGKGLWELIPFTLQRRLSLLRARARHLVACRPGSFARSRRGRPHHATLSRS